MFPFHLQIHLSHIMPSQTPTPDLSTILTNLTDLLLNNPLLPNEISGLCTARTELATLKQEMQDMLAEHQIHEQEWDKVLDETRMIASDKMMDIIQAVNTAVRDDASKEADLEGKLEEKRQEMAARLEAKDTEIAGMQAAHKNQLEGLKQQQKSSIEKVVKERDDAVLQAATRKDVIQRTQEELKETKELLSAEHIHRKKAEAKLAGIQQEVGVQDLVEPALYLPLPSPQPF
jgi:chromosome segregation ATPase